MYVSMKFRNEAARAEFVATFNARDAWEPIDTSEADGFSGDKAETAMDVANEILGVSYEIFPS